MSDEETPVPPGRLHRWVLRSRLLALLTALASVAALAAAVTLGRDVPPTRMDLLEKAGLAEKKELLIGVIDDMPRISERDADGRWSGFDIEIGHMVARYLGFSPDETTFVALASENRAGMRARREPGGWVSVDLVIASYSITPEREREPQVTFSAPYLTTWQSVITRRGRAPIQDLAALKGEKVCTIGTSTSERPAELVGVRLVRKIRIGDCVEGLLKNEYEAVTSDAVILAGFVHRHPGELMHHDIALDVAENYGINTGNNPALHTLVNRALWRSRHIPADRTWEEAFDRWIRPMQKINDPQDLAVDRQPEVPPTEVRENPAEPLSAPRPVR